MKADCCKPHNDCGVTDGCFAANPFALQVISCPVMELTLGWKLFGWRGEALAAYHCFTKITLERLSIIGWYILYVPEIYFEHIDRFLMKVNWRQVESLFSWSMCCQRHPHKRGRLYRVVVVQSLGPYFSMQGMFLPTLGEVTLSLVLISIICWQLRINVAVESILKLLTNPAVEFSSRVLFTCQ